ncbi:porin [Parvularcula oceani]|uniref:porin n=1 Tax=Parvularcula oceani TaxID=1247963 RepID=UPI0004E1DD21|nr:porin [Parvularcula oceani]
MRKRQGPRRAAGAALALAAGLCAVDLAVAQEHPIEVTGEATVVGGVVDGDARGDADAVLRAEGSTLLGNGLELGAGGSVRADGDMPENLFAGGRYSSLTAGGPRGLGISSGDIYLEGAYVFARGSFGSVHVGRDDGVAARLAVTSPTIFRSIGVNDWRTDLTGLNDVHTVNDFSGSATKLTYMPPAGFLGGLIGQLQLGLSYAPTLADCGGDACAPVPGYVVPFEPGASIQEQSWRDVVEAAVYYQNGFDVGSEPLLVGLSASYVRADEDEPVLRPGAVALPLGDYRSYALGLNLAYGNVTVGGSVKSTNAGILKERDEDYLAFDAGVTYEAGDWNFMLGYGAADAERDAGLLVGPMSGADPALIPYALDRQTQTAQAGVSKVFDQGVTLGVAAQFVDSDKPDPLGGKEDAAAIVLESAIRF